MDLARMILVGGSLEFGDVEDGAVDDAAGADQLGAALALDLLSGRTAAQDEPGGDGADATTAPAIAPITRGSCSDWPSIR